MTRQRETVAVLLLSNAMDAEFISDSSHTDARRRVIDLSMYFTPNRSGQEMIKLKLQVLDHWRLR